MWRPAATPPGVSMRCRPWAASSARFCRCSGSSRRTAPARRSQLSHSRSGGGCAPRQYRLAVGVRVSITGVENALEILVAGDRYIHLDGARPHEVVAYARYWLDPQAGHYDVVVLDAYRQPYNPFHLTTK